MDQIVLNLEEQLKRMKAEVDRRTNVYNWIDHDYRKLRKVKAYKEDLEILIDSTNKLSEIISDTKLLISVKQAG